MTDEMETQDEQDEEQDETPRRKKGKKGKKSKKSKRSKEKDSEEKPSKKSKGSKKGKGSKKKAKDDGDARSSVISTASALREIDAFNTRSVSKTLKAMAAGETPDNSAMVDLKEHVKTEAARLREEGDGSSASKLSSINRLVRRIERSTR
jgi:hypothetical protein